MDKYTDYIYRLPDQIPDAVFDASHLGAVLPELGARLGQHVSHMFPTFSKAFPLTVQSMEEHWPTPVLYAKPFKDVWLTAMLCMRDDGLKLCFDLRSADSDFDGPSFYQGREMLPARWLELYRYFDSFSIGPDPLFSRDWRDTPFKWSSRRDAIEYVQLLGMNKSKAKMIEKSVGSSRYDIRCWMLTDAGDALLLDEARNDKKVYHIHRNDLEDIVVLRRPEDALDRYMAHCVAGGNPAVFDFRV